MAFILASQSPRRRELLRQIGIGAFQTIAPAIEEAAPDGLSPGERVCHIAREKALAAAAFAQGGDVIIAADTIVVLDGMLLGKPADRDEAVRTLSLLSGRRHAVYTGVAVLRDRALLAEYEMTAVFFRPLSPKEIKAYVDTGEPMDKAGAYGAQGLGALFVQRIEGDFFNVMGLPVARLASMLKQLQIDLLDGHGSGQNEGSGPALV